MTGEAVVGWWRGFRSAESLRGRLMRATAWTLVGSISQQVCGVLASVGAARILGKVGFGEFGITRSTMMTFGVLAGSGLGLATTRYVAELRIADPARAGRVLGLLFRVAYITSGAAMILCFLLAQPLAVRAIHAPHLALPLALAGLLIVFNTIGGVQVGALTGLERFRSAAIVIAFDGLFVAVGVIVGAYAGGVVGAIAGSVAASACSLVLKQYLLDLECRRAGVSIERRVFRGELPIVWAFIVPSVLIGISTQPFEWLGRVLLSREPGGLAEIGVLTAAFAWGQLVLFIPTQVTGPALPILTNLLGSRDMVKFRRLLRSTLLVAIGSGLVAAVPVIALSKWIMRAYGKEFTQGWVVVTVFAAAYAIASLSAVFRAALLAAGQAWVQNGQAIIWGITLIISFLALRGFGSLGLAVSYAIAFVVVVVTQGLATLKTIRLVERRA